LKRFQWARAIGKVLRFAAFPLALRAEKKAHERLVSRGPDEEFEREIRDGFAALFSLYSARVVANDWYPINGRSSIVVVEVRNLRLRATLDRGYVAVDAAPLHSPTDWHLVEKILGVVLGSPFGYVSLSELAETLSRNLAAVESALAQNNYARTIAQLESTPPQPD
jgi:hypothetical protein